MRIEPLIFITAAASLLGCSSNWTMKETKSEMNDAVSYGLSTKSTRELKHSKDGKMYSPRIGVILKGDAASISLLSEQVYDLEMSRANHNLWFTKVTTRFDDEKPMDVMAYADGPNDALLVLPDRDALLEQMLKHKVLKVQYPLVSSGATVAEFKLDGFQSALIELCGKAPKACTKGGVFVAPLATVGVEIKGGP